MTKRKASAVDDRYLRSSTRQAARRPDAPDGRPILGKPDKPSKPEHDGIGQSRSAASAASPLPEGNSSNDNTSSSKDKSPSSPNTLHVTEKSGDIFSSPDNSVLIHACNTQGHWGAGIAAAFKSHYPESYVVYHEHCARAAEENRDLRGTALLIPPASEPQSDRSSPSAQSSKQTSPHRPNHFVGCLFTSRGKGRTKDSVASILANTGPAMRDLLSQIEDSRAGTTKQADGSLETPDDGGGEKQQQLSCPGELFMCKINSGLFRVPWEKTKSVLEGIELEGQTRVVSVTVVDK